MEKIVIIIDLWLTKSNPQKDKNEGFEGE